MKSRFPESKEHKAERIAGAAIRLARPAAEGLESRSGETLAPADVLEKRIALRIAAATPATPPDVAGAMASVMAKEGHATALKLARGELKLADLTERAVANLEAVIRTNNRPAWFVEDSLPMIESSDSNSESWIVLATGATRKMHEVCCAVGCIMKEQDDVRTPIGTGWLIAPSTLVTNAHVAGHLARLNPVAPPNDLRGRWGLRSDVSGVVNFLFEHGNSANQWIKIMQVLYVERAGGPDIAIFRLGDEGAQLPPAIVPDLNAQRAAGWSETNVFTVGHPVADLQDDANVQAVFGRLDGTKRLSPGRLMAILGDDTLTHDCSTTNGSSGSPVIDFASYQAVGLHYFGKPGERNEAVFLAAIAGHPAIVKSLSGDWGI